MCARRRSKKKEYRLERVGDFLPDVLKKGKIFIDTPISGLAGVWTRAVGPQIARQTEPIRIRNGVLSVKVTTSAWMQQLQFMKDDIIEKVNKAGPPQKINKIRFSIGEVSPFHFEQPSVENDPEVNERRLGKRDRRLIAERLSLIEDDELREIMRRVMIREAMNRNLRP